MMDLGPFYIFFFAVANVRVLPNEGLINTKTMTTYNSTEPMFPSLRDLSCTSICDILCTSTVYNLYAIFYARLYAIFYAHLRSICDLLCTSICDILCTSTVYMRSSMHVYMRYRRYVRHHAAPLSQRQHRRQPWQNASLKSWLKMTQTSGLATALNAPLDIAIVNR